MGKKNLVRKSPGQLPAANSKLPEVNWKTSDSPKLVISSEVKVLSLETPWTAWCKLQNGWAI